MSTEDEDPKDEDDTLLKASGRITVLRDIRDDVKDLKQQAQELGDRGQAIEETTVTELTTNNRILRRDNRFMKIAITILISLNIFSNYRATFVSGPKLESVQETVDGPLTDANAKLDDVIEFIEFIAPLICEGQIKEDPENVPEFCKTKP